MFDPLSQVRPGERRVTAIAFLTLLTVMAAHTMLETARDTLFLTGIPATRLPIVYLAVAGVTLGVAWVQLRQRGRPSARKLSLNLAGASLVTAAFGVLVSPRLPWTLYPLYVWSSVAVSVAVTKFFIVLGDRFTVAQAKRLYAVIGTGSVAGAIVGSGLASLAAEWLPARALIFTAALALLLSAGGPLLLASGAAPEAVSEGRTRSVARHPLRRLWPVFRDPYAGRLAWLIATGAVTLTLVDYVFKANLVAHSPPDRLAATFARTYLGLNLLSLVSQVLVVRRVVRSLAVTTAFAILPTLLLLGGAVSLVAGGLLGAIALKAADGGLRYSLHRTLSELLYLPLSQRLRAAAKIAIDLVGQRLGQAAASLGLLAAVALGATLWQLSALVVALAGAWIAQALALRPHYLKLFRGSLAAAAERSQTHYPALDVSSLESLMAALSSTVDAEVRAALHFIEEQGHTRAIPSLILYHPSPEVVADALDILGRSDRVDFLPLTQRLLDHEYAAVRTAALRARIARLREEELLHDKAGVECPEVRATALVGLAAGGYSSVRESEEAFQEISENGSVVARRALAQAIAYRPSPLFSSVLSRLATDPNPEVVEEALTAMQRQPTPQFLPVLLPLLAKRAHRPKVRDCLVALGEPAFAHLVAALQDPAQDRSVQRHIPRTLSRFESRTAAPVLTRLLAEHPDEVVRYKALRGLGRLVADSPRIDLDRAALEACATQIVAEIYRSLDFRLILEQGLVEQPRRKTDAHELLFGLLQGREKNDLERLFRVLGLLFANQDVGTLYRGLKSPRHELRSSSRELLEAFLSPPALRTAVLGLVDDAPDKVRIAAGSRFQGRSGLGYEALLAHLLEASDDLLRGLAVYQVAKLELLHLQPRINALEARSGFADAILRHARKNLPLPNPEPAE